MRLARVLLMIGAAAVGLWLLLPGSSLPPTDAEMIERFRRDRVVLEHLVAMIQENPGLRRVGATWTKPADPASVGVTAGRLADYRRNLQQIGLEHGFSSWDGGEHIEFIATSREIPLHADIKAYVWSSTGRFGDGPVLDSLDDTSKYEERKHNGERRAQAYRHIEGPWFLYVLWE